MSLWVVRTGLLVGLLTGGCNYRETVGRTGSDPTSDASPGCDGASCNTGDCSNFMVPSGDCTLGQGDCNFASDCPGINQDCNLATRRCFRSDQVCVGTPCGFDEDCPSNERCNQTAGICFDLNASQRCMPCFLLSTDCGTQSCHSDRGLCL